MSTGDSPMNIPEPSAPRIRTDFPKIPEVAPIPMDLDALVPEYVPQDAPPSWLDKFRGVWSILQVLVENLVTSAEAIHGAGTGPTKKAMVVKTAMEWLEEAEARVDFIPGWLHPVAFKALEMALGYLVEKVVKNFQARGMV